MRDYSFGNFLHELRTRRGLTQYQLGALVGVSDKAVSKWENGFSKPQIRILYKISEILGISIDELLTCKYHSYEKKDIKGVFAMKKQLWEKAFDAMCKRYGTYAPIEITNRFLSEQAEMQNTDMIVYFDMLSQLSANARKQGELIRVKGGTGASFIAYLLGATEIDPLKPHYYCPECHTVIFDNSVEDGWDLPHMICLCGTAMQGDGHNIPFEAYRHVVHRNTSFDVSVSPEFIHFAKSFVQEYFKDCNVTFEEREPNNVITFTVTSEKSQCSVTLYADKEFLLYKELERLTATSFERIIFACSEVLNEFQKYNTSGITGFKSDFMKNILRSIKPQSYYELIQMLGLSHGTGNLLDNEKAIIPSGLSIYNLIAYRDDVFNFIQEKMIAKGFTDTGFAYKVMEDTRKGLYVKGGIPDDIRYNLKAVGVDEGFVNSIGSIRYLFPKAHGVTYVKLALTLMWYKIHYPKEFNKIML